MGITIIRGDLLVCLVGAACGLMIKRKTRDVHGVSENSGTARHVALLDCGGLMLKEGPMDSPFNTIKRLK
jgi:hypothetical protein